MLTHHQHKAVDFNIVKGFGFFVATGVILGTIFAASLETKPLILFFTIIVYVLAFYLLFLKEKETNIEIKIGLFSKSISGIVSGFISAPMGIGGAVMNVPILKFFGYPINKAIGSAAAIGFIIALFGTGGFLISGSYLKADLPLSIGFLIIPALKFALSSELPATHYLNFTDLIFILKRLLSDVECNQIIEEYESSPAEEVNECCPHAFSGENIYSPNTVKKAAIGTVPFDIIHKSIETAKNIIVKKSKEMILNQLETS